MAKTSPQIAAFNRGVVSKRAQARVDVDRIALSADQQTNWRPETLGPMALRVGTEYLLNTGVYLPHYLPFVFAADDTALLELIDGEVRVVVDDAALTFANVVAAVANGDMEPDLTSWTDADDSGATSEHSTSTAVVTLSNQTVHDVATSPADATAKYKLDSDGSAYTMADVLDGGVYTAILGQWKLSGAAAAYDAKATVISGTVSGSATGTALNLGSDREWTATRSPLGTTTSVIFVELFTAGGTDALASATITLKAQVESSA